MGINVIGEAVDRIGGEPISARMARKAPIRHLDPTLVMVTLLLAAYGAVMVGAVDPAYFQRQIVYGIVGGVVLIVAALFDYRYLRALSFVLYGLTILTLVAVLTPLGDLNNGARSWFDFGAFQIHPSELAKISVIVAVSAFLAERRDEVRALDVIVTLGIVGIPIVLVQLQPDLGTMLVFVAFAAGLLLVAGAKIRHFLVLALVGIVAVIGVLQMDLLEQYQIDRITAFLDEDPDVQSTAYNLFQAEITIASGGMRGKGLEAENTQTDLDFVPEQHTDFIFTAVAEQLGFVGGATLLGLFAFLLWRALRIASMSRDMFGTLLAVGIATMWAFQIFVNIGMTMGIMPITGLPLPFVSYGGSAMITNFLAAGILLNVHMRRHL